MMLPTHVMVGVVLGLALAAVAPEFAGVLVVSAIVGSVLPDLDMYLGHRKTLHYPVYFTALAGFAIVIAILFPSTLTVATVGVTMAAAVHSVSDIFGGGLELRPWEATDDRGVFDHWRGRWIAPRRLIPYDGSPRDLGVSFAFGLPAYAIVEGPLGSFVLLTLGVAAVYSAVRRRLPDLAEYLLDLLFDHLLPRAVVMRLPERYRREQLMPGGG